MVLRIFCDIETFSCTVNFCVSLILESFHLIKLKKYYTLLCLHFYRKIICATLLNDILQTCVIDTEFVKAIRYSEKYISIKYHAYRFKYN